MEPQAPEQLTKVKTTVTETVQTLAKSVPFAILVAAAMISGSILYVGSGRIPSANLQNGAADDSQQAAATATPIANPSELYGPNDAVIGNKNAKVTIVEFSDFQCPYCRMFVVNTFGQIKKDYIDTGKVKFVFRDFPLKDAHPAALSSALAGQCAREQGKFWEFHDTIFAEQQKQEPDPTKVSKTVTYTADNIKTWAAQIGVNTQQFNSCLDSQKYASKVDQDLADGTKFGVDGTPTFFVNGKQLVGAMPYAQFKAAIDAAL